MKYSCNNRQYLETESDRDILEVSIMLAKAYAFDGWRMSTIQWATPAKAEYACYFADPSDCGEDWGDEPWDTRFWSVVIVDDDGERIYNWNCELQRFDLAPTDDNKIVEPGEEAPEEAPF